MKSMKKIMTGVFALVFISNAAYAMSGTVTVGFEQRDYNSTSDESRDAKSTTAGSKNYIEPYVSGVLSPIKGSPLKLIATYKYRHHDGSGANEERQWDRRDTYEFYAAYDFRMDKLRFVPQIGTVIEDYDSQNRAELNRTKYGKTETLIQYRLYPNLNYSITKDLTFLMVNGYFAPVTKKVVGGETHGGNYKYELSTGLSYRIDSASTVQATLFFAGDKYTKASNSYEGLDSKLKPTYYEKGETSTRNTEFRVQYSYTMLDKKLNLRPYVRIPIERERKANVGIVDKNGKSTAYHYDEPETRIGMAASYKVTPSFTVFSDIWYDHLKSQNYSNGTADKPSEHYWAFKAGFTQAF